jgi:signal transduction histidine kinase/HPt (histidine-containing phosphotransfer) domain-containing protein/CheY-like chemotaxis protein/PAS domain-containing protein
MLLPYLIIFEIITLLAVVVAVFAWRQRHMPSARALEWLAWSVAVWVLFYTIELQAPTIESKLVAARLQYLGIICVPLAWLAFTRQYTGNHRWPNRRTFGLLSIIPLLTLGLVWTNDLHGLIWSDVTLDPSARFPALSISHGPWFWVHTLYCYILMALGSISLLRVLRRSPKLYRWQLGALLVAALTPWLGNVLYLLQLDPLHPLDLTPLGFVISELILVWSLFDFRLFDLAPIAYGAIFHGMRGGAIVLDGLNRVADYNAHALEIARLYPARPLEQPIETFLSHQPELLSCCNEEENAHLEIQVSTSHGQYSYDAHVTPLVRHSKTSGRLIILNDITELKRAQATQHFLAEASKLLASSLDYETTLVHVAQLTVPQLADWCMIHLVDEDYALRRVALSFADPTKQPLAEELQRDYPLGINAPHSYPHVIRTGQPELIAEVSDQDLHEIAHDARHLELLRALGFCSTISVPLIARERTLGSIMLGTAESGRRYDATDLQIAEELAGRVALAVDNAWLFAERSTAANRLLRQNEELTALHEENARLYNAAQQEIAERRHTEVALRAAEASLRAAKDQAEAATRAKSELLAHMSHDMRTPISSAIGITQLLERTNLDTEQRELVGIIRISGDVLLTLVNNFLDLAKIEAGKLTLERHPFVLQSCIEAMIDLVAGDVLAKQLDLAYTLDPHIPAILIGDQSRLQQILINLLSNAVKFTSTGGILLSVDGQPTPAGQYEIHVCVADTGIGIPPDQLEHVFRPFEQVDVMAARPTHGTGLGLAIAKQLSELMGGHMWVESAVGQGSTFHFTVCVGAVAESLAATPAADDPELASLREQHILIVDRNPQSRHALSVYAHSIGMRASVADTASQALALAEAGARFDLAAIALRDAAIEGGWLGTALQQRYGMPKLHILGLVPRGLPDQEIPGAAFDLVVYKPLKLSQLREALLRPRGNARAAEVGAAPLNRSDQRQHSIPAPRVLLVEDDHAHGAIAPAVPSGPRAHADETGSTAPPLDPQALERLRSLFGPHRARLHALIEHYCADTAAHTASMYQAAAENDIDSLRTSIHELMSSSATVAALPLVQLCKQFEAAINANHHDEWPIWIQKIEAELLRVQNALREELAD